MFDCLFSIQNPNRWTDLDEIWHRGGPQGGEGSCFFYPVPPPWYMMHNGGPWCLWSLNCAIWQNLTKTNIAGQCIAIWSGLRPPKLTPWSRGAPMWFWSLSNAFWRTLYNTKVAGHPQLCGGRSPVWTLNPDLEGPGPVCFWSNGA